MNSSARAGSTGFQVSASTFREVPTTHPSARRRMSATLSCRTPVFASTGTSRDLLPHAFEVFQRRGLARHRP